MATFEIDKRLLEVLEVFLLPNYNITSVTYVDLLLTHIRENIKKQCKTINRCYIAFY